VFFAVKFLILNMTGMRNVKYGWYGKYIGAGMYFGDISGINSLQKSEGILRKNMKVTICHFSAHI
jgi:hypothetical protein